jgi:hypothetical protein
LTFTRLHGVITQKIELLPSPRRYSGGWAMASWKICLHFSLFRGWLSGFWTINFYGVRLLASRPTPKLDDQDIPLRLDPTPWPVRGPYQ